MSIGPTYLETTYCNRAILNLQSQSQKIKQIERKNIGNYLNIPTKIEP